MPENRVVQRALVALSEGGTVYPMDCLIMEMDQLVALAQWSGAWDALRWTTTVLFGGGTHASYF